MFPAALMTALLLSTPPEEVDVEEVDVLDVADCPAIFGDDRVHEGNESYRSRRLHDFTVTDERVEIVHSVGHWQKPGRMRVRGVELLDVEPPDVEPGEKIDPRERVALVEVKEELGHICSPGVYAVGVDDALGRKSRVLAIHDRGVLLEASGDLHFLPWEGHALPQQVRMVWRSSYDVVLDEKGGGGGGKKGAAKRRKRGRKRKAKAKRKPAKKR